MKPYDGIIFDVDGTLWYSCDKVAKFWSIAATEYLGREIHWTGALIEPMFGQPMDVFLDTLLPGLTREQKDQLSRKLWDKENELLVNDPGVLYPGVAEGLKELSRDHRLFIVSNCQKGYIEVLLDSYGLRPYVEGWLCWEDTCDRKGVTIRTLMERCGLKNALYVGDTQGDADECAWAGVDFLWAAYGIGKVHNPPEQIGSFAELLAHL